jgi:hypothetical protein
MISRPANQVLQPVIRERGFWINTGIGWNDIFSPFCEARPRLGSPSVPGFSKPQTQLGEPFRLCRRIGAQLRSPARMPKLLQARRLYPYDQNCSSTLGMVRSFGIPEVSVDVDNRMRGFDRAAGRLID